MRALPAAVLAILGLTTTASTQAVISKVDFSNQFIEIFNSDPANEVDLSTWSIYYATTTLGQPGNYWFAFPTDTIIPPAGFLKVNWLAGTGSMPPGELNTGSSIFNFLFGFLPEGLINAPTAGEPTFTAGLGLLNTQNNLEVNSPIFYQDWVTWGDATSPARPPREDLAVANGVWTPGGTVAAPVGEDAALGRDDVVTGSVWWSFAQQLNSSSCVFSFPTPVTPPNPPPEIAVFTEATTGNLNFGLRFDPVPTSGASFILFGTTPGSSTPVLLGCPIWVGGIIEGLPVVASGGTVSLAGFLGLPKIDVYMQGIGIDQAPDPTRPGETVLLITFGRGSQLTIGI